ncbi:MAG: 5' nucleotidase, NT5C type [Candidatus Limnocylindria bacterium]
MRIGVDLDDVVAVCAVPYLKRFAERYQLDLSGEDLGWHTLAALASVPPEEKDRFRRELYDGTFFGELEPYEDCPAALERMVEAGHELYFVTARAERRRVVTETWLREQGLIEHARAVHLRPHGDFDPLAPVGRYDASSSARYKTRLARELDLEAFCEDDEVIARALAEEGVRVWLFDQPWNRGLEHPNIARVRGWSDVLDALGLTA